MRGDRGWDSEGQQTSEEGTCLSQEGGAPAFLRRVRPPGCHLCAGDKAKAWREEGLRPHTPLGLTA